MKRLPFRILDTGAGTGVSYRHTVYTNLNGEPFDVVATVKYAPHTYEKVYQIVPVNKRILVFCSQGVVGKHHCTEILLGTLAKLEPITKFYWPLNEMSVKIIEMFNEIDTWREREGAHFPPGITKVVPINLSAWGLTAKTPEEAKRLLNMLRDELPVGSNDYAIDPVEGITLPDLEFHGGISPKICYLFPSVAPPLRMDSVTVGHYIVQFNPPVFLLESADVFYTWGAFLWTSKPVTVKITNKQNDKCFTIQLPAGFLWGGLQKTPAAQSLTNEIIGL
ncbi:MAG: hypothetical protein ABDH29_04180 [Aquificaceae bacterium]